MKTNWQKKVTKERKKLNKKLSKLVDFSNSTQFQSVSKDMQNMLMAQMSAMATYSNILTARLDYMDN